MHLYLQNYIIMKEMKRIKNVTSQFEKEKLFIARIFSLEFTLISPKEICVTGNGNATR
jgi:hypothetical protein